LKGLAALALLVACAASAAPAAGATPRELDEIVRERLAESPAPVCVAVGVVEPAQSRTTFACSSGAGPAAFDQDSIFEIGSVTKGLTGLLLADMVVRDEVRIDDPASKYSRPGARLPKRGGREILLRDLVTHTAGLPRNPFERRGASNPYGYVDEDALYAALAEAELTHDIGTQYGYSNLGFMWLSDLLARRAGKSYEALLTERILAPLGMTSTAVRLTPRQQARFVKGHGAVYDEIAPWTIGGNLQGVGHVRSSLRDMMRLSEALAGMRSTPLDAAISVALDPPSPIAAPEVGYAWNVRGEPAERRYDHGGGTGGFVAHVAFDRTRRRAAVVLADARASIFDLALHLVDRSYDLRRAFVVVPLDAAARRQFVGAYSATAGQRLEVSEDGNRLIARGDGLPTVELMHQGRDAFFVPGFDALFVFSRGADGLIDGVASYLDQRRTAWRRTPP
jgi:D-alanyl-D-alanine-carboxypeptidase/D-alanyl-D-alanine-endopeptidase